MNIFFDLEGEEVMLKYRKIKAYVLVESLIALMISIFTLLLLSSVLGNSLKREQYHKCMLNEYSYQLMSLHEKRPPVPYSEVKKYINDSKLSVEKKINDSSIKKEKIKKVVHYKTTESNVAPISIITHCEKEEVIQIEEIGPTEKGSISSN